MVAPASRADITAPSLGTLRFVSLRATESLGAPTRMILRCQTDGVSAPACVGEAVSVAVVYGASDAERHFHGVVVEAAQLHGHDDERAVLELTLATRLEALRLGQDCRIFQQLNTVDVVSAVFERAGIADETQWLADGSYAPSPYTVQFNESDLDFAERLLAEDGIGYAVTHDAAGAQVLLFDDLRQLERIEGDAVPFAAGTASSTTEERPHVFDLREVRRATSDTAMLRDYDLTRPASDLSARAEADEAAGRQVYLHPGRTVDDALLAQRTQRLLEKLRVRGHTIEGRSTCRAFEAGRVFELVDHPRDGVDGEYVLLSVEHDEHADHYENRFVAIPRSGAYRPERAVTLPRVGGTQVAFVTGSAGAELHGSERGQVKARFVWDRSGATDDTSSTWLRVGQVPMPGPMIVPRVGFEVIVDYELGDLDRPFVRGHLYHGEAPVPYALPEHATRTALQTATTEGGPGVNELRFEDTGGAEEIFLNASRDMTVSIEHDANTAVVANETVQIGSNHTVIVGANLNEAVTGSRSLSIGGDQSLNTAANYTDSIGGNLTFTSGSRSFKAGGDYTENVGGALDRTVSGLQCVTGITGYDRQIVGASSTSVGGAMVAMTAASLSSTCGAVRNEKVGALKLIKAKTVSVSCGAAYVMNAASESVKCGADKTDTAEGAVAVTAAGGMSVKATNINISGESKVVLRLGGTVIEVLPGSVKIKSGRIEVKTLKQLGSGPGHETN